jgi:hypothetical protein
VLPETRRGMIEASATRRPSTPRTFKSSETTAIASSGAPIFAGAGGMEHGFGDRADIVAQGVLVLFQPWLRHYAPRDKPRKRRRLGYPDAEFDPAHQRVDISLDRERVGDEQRRVTRIVRAQPHRAARLRPQYAGSNRDAVPGFGEPIREADETGQHVKLDVRFARTINTPIAFLQFMTLPSLKNYLWPAVLSALSFYCAGRSRQRQGRWRADAQNPLRRFRIREPRPRSWTRAQGA